MSAYNNGNSAATHARRARLAAQDEVTENLAKSLEYLGRAIADLGSELDYVRRQTR
jgi:hypothetical protein